MRRRCVVGCGVSILVCATSAFAEPSGAQKAAAEALFQEAANLVGAGKTAQACQKFAASQELDPALGTLLRLADCRDREGKSASAWALFLEAAALSGQRGETQRRDLAAQRAADLEQRLSKLVLRLPKHLPEDATVKLNGLSIPRASWSSPLPVDPGKTLLEVSAPGFMPWHHEVETPPGPSVSEVPVPLLERAPELVKTAPPSSEQRSLSPKPEADRPWDVVGYVVGSLGLIGLGVGSYLTVRAYDANSDSLDHCRTDDKNRCTAEGTRLRDDAKSFADGATVAFAVGGTLLLAGVTLVIVGPTSRREAPVARLTLSADAMRDGGGLHLRGAF